MQEICRNSQMEHTGNRNLLLNHIRRYVEANREHDSMVRVEFPRLPPGLAQQSFDINTLLEQFRTPNPRSTVNFENLPLHNDPNMSAIMNETETGTNFPDFNTTMQASSHVSQQPSNSQILVGNLSYFGQTITSSAPETQAIQILPRHSNFS